MDDMERTVRMAGYLFPEEITPPRPICPESWLNDPRHHEFVDIYTFALTHFEALAARAFERLDPEQVYLVWKTIETARAGLGRRWVAGRYTP